MFLSLQTSLPDRAERASLVVFVIPPSWGKVECFLPCNNRVAIQSPGMVNPVPAPLGFSIGQVHTQTPIEVGIGRHVLHELLFVGDIHSVIPRVRIALA